MRTNRLHLLFTIGLSLIGLGASASDLRFYLTPAQLTGAPGELLTFSGHLENTGRTELFFNSDTLILSGTGLTTDDDPFVLNAPLSLLSTGSKDVNGNLLDRWDGDLFTVKIGGSVTPGTYFGFFRVQGGANDSSSDVLNRQDFQIVVAPSAVPEPGELALLVCSFGTGIGLLAARRTRNK